MRISRIKVANHRSIPDLDFEVRKHLVIVGPNETGKTRLLEILNSLLSKTHGQLTYELNETSPFRNISEKLEIEIALTDFTEEEQIVFGHLFQRLEEGALGRLRLRLCAGIDDDGETVSFERGFVKDSDEDSFVEKSDRLASLLGWAYLPADRHPDKELAPNRSSSIRKLLDHVYSGNSSADIKAQLNNLYEKIRELSNIDTTFSNISSALTDLLPREVSKEDIKLKYPGADTIDYLRGIRVHLQDHVPQVEGEGASQVVSETSQDRPLQDQSDGIRSMVTVIVQLLTMTDTNIVAIDEPEIHLHPKAQARFASWLKNRKEQLIIATHSAAVLEKFHPEEVLALKSAGDCRQLASEVLKNEKRCGKLLTHWWTSTALEFITSRSAIIVEGTTDRILLQAAAKAMGYDFDQIGVSVVQLGGKGDFKDFIGIFGKDGFNIPLVFLRDKDKDRIEKIANDFGYPQNDKFMLNKNHIWLAEPDIENECIQSLGAEDHSNFLVDSGLITRENLVNELEGSNISEMEIATYLKWFKDSQILNLHKTTHMVRLVENLDKETAEKLTLLRRVIEDAKNEAIKN